MSDPLENFIRNHRDRFDQESPGQEVWEGIQQGLDQVPAPGSGAPTPSGGSWWSQVPMLWKALSGLVLVGVTSSVIYFASQSGEASPTSEPNSASALLQQEPEPEPARPLVAPPLPTADVAFHSFTLKARKGGQWTSPTGTRIEVPKGIFVDADGNRVKGEVEIRFREFHDAADILLSGITMYYDENGQKGDFQTAGMMEIRGFQDGEPVYIAQGESIEVSLASYTDEPGHRLYLLEPEKGWADIGEAQLGPNSNAVARRESETDALRQAPVKPRKPAKNSPDKGITLEVDYEDFPEIKPYQNIRWMPLDEAYFADNQWAFTVAWNSVELIEVDPTSLAYQLHFSKGNRQFQIDVTPMLEGEDYQKAMDRFDQKMKAYRKELNARKKEDKRIAQQAEFSRSFSISGFGIYNCDRILNMPNRLFVRAKVGVPDQPSIRLKQTQVFHITGDNRSVIPYQADRMDRFVFDPSMNNMLVVLLADGEVGLFSNDDFKRLNLSQIKSEGEHAFDFEPTGQKVASAADLRMAIGI